MRVNLEPISHPQHAFRYLRFQVDGFRGEPHRHRHLELTWIESGDGLRFVGDSAEPFRAGEIVLVGSGTPHGWVSARDSGPGIATVAQFAPEFLAQSGWPELAAWAPLAERAAVGLAIAGRAHEQLIPMLEALRDARPIGRVATLLGILDLLLAHEHELRAIARSPMRTNSRDDGVQSSSRRIDRVIGWIHRGLDRELAVADAARVAGITPGAFSRYFRNAVGRTFTQYVNDVRCSEACIRLRQGDRAIALVAAECGFETLSHFHRQFRLRFGMAPSDYRRGRPARSGAPDEP